MNEPSSETGSAKGSLQPTDEAPTLTGRPTALVNAAKTREARCRVPVSVLMSTYAGETAENLDEAVESIFAQTVRPVELVVVLDGPIGAEQEAILERYRARSAEIPIVCVNLGKNVGLANALNAGLSRCQGQYICRMDSDDVCVPHRLERQWAVAQRHPEVDCIGAWHLEFQTEIKMCDRMKTAPEFHEGIVRALKWRNVFSHPTMLVKTEALTGIGGYRHFKLGLSVFGKTLFEDYDCLIRLIQSGRRLHVIQEPLLYFRRTRAQMRRRGGLSFLVRDLTFRFHHVRTGFFPIGHVLIYAPVAVCCHLAPSFFRSSLYLLVREPINGRHFDGGEPQP